MGESIPDLAAEAASAVGFPPRAGRFSDWPPLRTALRFRYHAAVPDQPDNSSDSKDPHAPHVQPYNHQPVGARVPERVGRGVYSTGQVVLDSPKEFVIDFLQALTRPHQVVARVILTPQTMAEFQIALDENLGAYSRSFGPPAPLPPPPADYRPPTIQEIYENFKLPEDMLSGAYANSVLIGHSPTEFFFDFISGFYPTSAVSSRVFMPAQIAPRFLSTLDTCLKQFNLRHGKKDGPP